MGLMAVFWMLSQFSSLNCPCHHGHIPDPYPLPQEFICEGTTSGHPEPYASCATIRNDTIKSDTNKTNSLNACKIELLFLSLQQKQNGFQMMRRIGLLITLLLCMFAIHKIVAAEIGDANGDGVVNVADIIAVVNAACGQESDEFDMSAADMNGDGAITAEDVKLIVNKIIRPDFDLSNAFIDDYERAFMQGYLAKGYYYYDRKQQITSQEFKAMLKPLIEKFRPDSMAFFNSRISDANAPIPRYIAAGMAYYVARCIGLLIQNSPYHRSEYDNLWEGAWDDIELLDRILPYANVPSTDGDNDWIEMINALLWHAEFVSVVSNKEIVAYNEEADSWLWNKPFLWEDAVRAITRFYDSFEPEIEYVDLDDPRVTKPNADIITSELIAEAAKKEIHDIEDMPRIIGVQLGGGGNQVSELSMQFGTTVKEVKEVADWGFNSMLSN